MAKPIIKTITPFDATTSKLVTFVWTGAMAYGNRMIIYNADENRPVYDKTLLPCYRLEHEISAGVLRNGVKYAAQIAVIDEGGNESAFSDKYYFETVTTPEFYFRDLDPSGLNKIQNAIYTASLYYDQEDHVQLTSYQFFLLSSAKEVLLSSPVLHDSAMTYVYRSLKNDTVYYFRAVGVNAKNVEVRTDDVMVMASYESPSVYYLIDTDVNEKIGSVDYHTNIIDIESDRPASEYEFDADGFIDLTGINPYGSLVIQRTESGAMSVNYSDIDDQECVVYSEDTSPFSITDYKKVNSIAIVGKVEYSTAVFTQISPGVYENDFGSMSIIKSIDLTLNSDTFNNITDSMELYYINGYLYDSITIKADGTRIINKKLGHKVLTPDDEPISQQYDSASGVSEAVFDIGATGDYGESSILCTVYPIKGIDPGIISCAFLDNEGLLHLRANVDEIDVNAYAEYILQYGINIIYPLKIFETIYLPPIELPSLENMNSVRYSRNFVIPGNTTTVSVQIKDAFKTQTVLRLQDENGKDTVKLTSMIYDDNTLRFKLVAYGPFSDYIVYSDPLSFSSYDIITLHIRRDNGVYGLYTFITEVDPDPLRNYWFVDNEPNPDDTTRGDIWINRQLSPIFVSKDTIVRYYGPSEPAGAQKEDIWIGD